MREDEIIAILRDLDLFAGFSDDQFRLLAFVSEERALGAGEVLYQAGDRPDGAYVLVSGALEVSDDNAHPQSYKVARPAIVGELGLMLSRPRPVTVSARSRADLIHVPREPFLKLLRADPVLAESVAAILRAELVRYLDSIVGLGGRFSGQ